MCRGARFVIVYLRELDGEISLEEGRRLLGLLSKRRGVLRKMKLGIVIFEGDERRGL